MVTVPVNPPVVADWHRAARRPPESGGEQKNHARKLWGAFMRWYRAGNRIVAWNRRLNSILIFSLRLPYAPLPYSWNMETMRTANFASIRELSRRMAAGELDVVVPYTEWSVTDAVLQARGGLDRGAECPVCAGGGAHRAVCRAVRMPGGGARPPGGATGGTGRPLPVARQPASGAGAGPRGRLPLTC